MSETATAQEWAQELERASKVGVAELLKVRDELNERWTQ